MSKTEDKKLLSHTLYVEKNKEAKLLPMKSEDVEADRDADCDIAIAAGVAGADAGAVAVAVPPLSNLIMVSRIH